MASTTECENRVPEVSDGKNPILLPEEQPVDVGIVKKGARLTPPPAIGPTSAKDVEDLIPGMNALKRRKIEALKDIKPKYLRFYYGGCDSDLFATTASWSEMAMPLPDPPDDEIHNTKSIQTLREHPDLFKIVTPINIDVLES